MCSCLTSLTGIDTRQCTHTNTPRHTKTQRGKQPFNMSCCDVITFHVMWKIIQSQWDGKCSAVYHRNWHCLLPSSTSFALSQSQLFSVLLSYTFHYSVSHASFNYAGVRMPVCSPSWVSCCIVFFVYLFCQVGFRIHLLNLSSSQTLCIIHII